MWLLVFLMVGLLLCSINGSLDFHILVQYCFEVGYVSLDYVDARHIVVSYLGSILSPFISIIPIIIFFYHSLSPTSLLQTWLHSESYHFSYLLFIYIYSPSPSSSLVHYQITSLVSCFLSSASITVPLTTCTFIRVSPILRLLQVFSYILHFQTYFLV